MPHETIINVIVPLKVDMIPCYVAPTADVTSGRLGVGSRVKVEFAHKVYTGVVETLNAMPTVEDAKIKPILSIEDDLSRISEGELRLWKFVSQYYMCSIGEVLKSAYPQGKLSAEKVLSGKRLRAEKKRLKGKEIATGPSGPRNDEVAGDSGLRNDELTGTSEARNDEAGSGPRNDEAAGDSGPRNDEAALQIPQIELSAAQSKALSEIKGAADKPVLLNGITGSGKTEIFLSLARESLQSGHNVLYIVPEIALSRQLEDRIGKIFGDLLLTFHSKTTPAHRRDVADQIKNRNYIVLGTRSSLFLPHNNLGLIIVDEEHDRSYKQDSPAPRYNGRDVAVMLARLHHCPVVLGSATPSLESLYNCETGRYAQVLLTQRYYGASPAQVEIIDTLAERRKRGMVGSFSIKLIEHIRKTLAQGEQVAILRGRRAYSPIVQCEDCGEIPRCPHCNVTLSYHKASGRLVCHYCGHSEPYSGHCGKCGGTLSPVGAGTEKIEAEVRTLFPEARVARLDSDTAKSVTVEKAIIKDFAQRNIDILVGTQIVAKGLDFEGLTLVAVIAADTLAGQEDFRADERALQTLEQFRGRCGRRGAKGLFVIQTAQSDKPVYAQLLGTSGNFIAEELSARRAFGYPPYSRIVNIIIKDTNELRLRKLADSLVQCVRALFPSGGRVSDAVAPVIDKLSDEFILMVRVMLPRDNALKVSKKRLLSTIQRFEREKGYLNHITLDVDPL